LDAEILSKESIRQAMLDRRGRLDIDQAQAAAEQIALRLLQRPEIASAEAIGLYSAFRGEVSTRTCFERLREKTARLYLPRVREDAGRVEFVRVEDWKQLTRGYNGIWEPEATLPATDLQDIGVLVVPGVAFDLRGYRLGWGKGFYDRALHRYAGARIGLAYDFQILERIPAGPVDERVDIVISEARVIEGPPDLKE
jgi:5-formyltetrahydrofolate cyclo-ligase